MSSEQIRLFAKGKETLTKKDVDFIRQQVDVTMAPSTESTKQAILLNRDRLAKHAEKITAMCDKEEQIRKEMCEYKKKLEGVLEGATLSRKQLDANTEALERERQKLLVLKSLKEFQSLKSDIATSLKELRFRKAEESIARAQQIGESLRIKRQLNVLQGEWTALVQASYNEALSIKESSFSLGELPSLVSVLKALDICAHFVDFFFDYLQQQFLPALAKCKTALNRDKQAFSIVGRKESNNPANFLTTAISLLQQVTSVFERASLQVSDARLAEFAKCAFGIGLKLPGGNSEELESAAKEMCLVTKTEMIDINTLMKGSRLPVVLGKCRALLADGKPFAEVVKVMKTMMEGTDSTGVLKEIALLATVIWSNDRAKLEGSIPTLVALGTRDAFDAAMVIDRFVNEKPQ